MDMSKNCLFTEPELILIRDIVKQKFEKAKDAAPFINAIKPHPDRIWTVEHHDLYLETHDLYLETMKSIIKKCEK